MKNLFLSLILASTASFAAPQARAQDADVEAIILNGLCLMFPEQCTQASISDQIATRDDVVRFCENLDTFGGKRQT